MLGAYQRRVLDEAVDCILRRGMRIEFYGMDARPKTREWGSGHAICFQMFESLTETIEAKYAYRHHIANVTYEDHIQTKIKELTAYLMERGVPREKIKAQRIRGKYL